MDDFGIEPGDIVSTSYGSGPYIVTRVHGPFDWHFGWNEEGQLDKLPSEQAHWSLSMKGAPGSNYEGKVGFSINGIRCPEGGRYFTYQGDEVYVAKPLNIWHVLSPAQVSLFDKERV